MSPFAALVLTGYRDEVGRDGSGRARAPRTVVILVWAAATLFGLGVAATTRIGPVLFSVSATHGVHLGDLVAFAAAYGAALVTTLRRSGPTATRRVRRGARAAEAPPDRAPRRR